MRKKQKQNSTKKELTRRKRDKNKGLPKEPMSDNTHVQDEGGKINLKEVNNTTKNRKQHHLPNYLVLLMFCPLHYLSSSMRGAVSSNIVYRQIHFS